MELTSQSRINAGVYVKISVSLNRIMAFRTMYSIYCCFSFHGSTTVATKMYITQLVGMKAFATQEIGIAYICDGLICN